jgi:hypothetical protein
MWGMRASAGSDPTSVGTAAPRRRLPRPVVWLLWLVAALVGSVVLGFLAGLARPREPDPRSSATAPSPPSSPHPSTTEVD